MEIDNISRNKMAREEYIFSFANLYRRYLECRQRKRGTINALKFELNAEENLWQLSRELQDKSYQPLRAVVFVVDKPKLREIIAADFRDRVVHHVAVERLEQIFEPKFIYDSYACRKDKGVHCAVDRLQGFIRNLSGRNKPLYYLQLDIESFFINIDKNILYGLIRSKTRQQDLLWLTREIIFHNPADNYIVKGDKRLWEKIPAHKSLLKSGIVEKGLPIGNLTSQFFANVYLNELDQFVKHQLKCRHYLRYCDDFILLSDDVDELGAAKTAIREFLQTRLQLQLNPRYGQILPLSNGVDFLGYIVNRDYKLVRKRVINNLEEKLQQFKNKLLEEQGKELRIHYDYPQLLKLWAVLSSYLGHFAHADSYRLQQSVIKRHNWLAEFFSLDDRESGTIKPRARFCHPQIWRNIAEQYGYYRHIFPATVLLFQVGAYFEFYDTPAVLVLELLQLQPLAANHRRALYGFPLRLEDYYCRRLLTAGFTLVVIKQSGIIIQRLHQRLPQYKLIYNHQGVNK